MGHRNPIHVVGQRLPKGFTTMSDELIRSAPGGRLGQDGFMVMAYLLSWAGTSTGRGRPYETSAVALSQQFGWGANRVRATRAIESAVEDQRLIVRRYVRDGSEVRGRCAYVVCFGGRRFTDAEMQQWSSPIELPPKPANLHRSGAP